MPMMQTGLRNTRIKVRLDGAGGYDLWKVYSEILPEGVPFKAINGYNKKN